MYKSCTKSWYLSFLAIFHAPALSKYVALSLAEEADALIDMPPWLSERPIRQLKFLSFS